MKLKIIFLLVVLVLLTSCSSAIFTKESVAKCLAEKGAAMYGSEWCGHCQNQKEMFGAAFQFIQYFDCDKNIQACQQAGIEAFPTWIINGKKYLGEKTLFELASLSDC